MMNILIFLFSLFLPENMLIMTESLHLISHNHPESRFGISHNHPESRFGVLGSFDFISTFLSSNHIGILGLYETFFSDSNSSSVGISGYRVVSRNRATRSKDKFALFNNQDLYIREITDFSDFY